MLSGIRPGLEHTTPPPWQSPDILASHHPFSVFHVSPSVEKRPSVLWCLYFNMVDGASVEVEGHDLPSNVYVCSGPDGSLGHDYAIKQVSLTHT